jgi:tetraacyldisaccharide 4'-kinase
VGNPEAFRGTLARLGLRVGSFRVYPDHHRYRAADLDELHRWARQQADGCVVATTQKDLVKVPLPRLGGKELWALRIGLRVEAGQEALDHQLHQVLRGRV